MASHEEIVSRISVAVRTYFLRKESFRIFHGSNNSTRPAHHSRTVDISALSRVLEIDDVQRTATVEPNVAMDKLVRATLEHGMIPPVVMEFPGITVGGGYAGSAGESSSFKYGYFNETVTSVEMVLGSGDIINASAQNHSDIFKGAAGALGTLGITTKVQLKLIKAKQFVELTYHPYTTVSETIKAIQRAIEDPINDYVDGVLFSNTHGVVMTGRLTNDKPTSRVPQSFSGPWDPWFYLHVRGKPLAERSTDYIPVAEYLFRYDRGGFWVGNEAFKYFNLVPFNRITRWLLNDFMHTRMMFRALHGSGMSFGTMVHDVAVPYPSVEKFLEYTSNELGIWPLWLCPLRAAQPPTFHPCTSGLDQTKSSAPMLNVGLWGAASKDIDLFIRQNQRLEAQVTELGGRKVLYSHTYYTEEEFWQLYDRRWYETLRQKYTAATLPTVFDKVKVNAAEHILARSLPWYRRVGLNWPFAGFYGIWCAIKSKDYYIHRDLRWMRWKTKAKE